MSDEISLLTNPHAPTTRFVYDAQGNEVSEVVIEDGKMGIINSHNVDDALQYAAEMRDAQRDKPKQSEYRLVGTIPAAVYEQAMREGWADDTKRLRAWLMDRDNSAFRVADG